MATPGCANRVTSWQFLVAQGTPQAQVETVQRRSESILAKARLRDLPVALQSTLQLVSQVVIETTSQRARFQHRQHANQRDNVLRGQRLG